MSGIIHPYPNYPSVTAVNPLLVGSITNISNNGAVSSGISSSAAMSNMRGLTLTSTPPIINTPKHAINIDELYEDLIAIKQIMIELAKDENLMERNSIVRDILSTWLIKGLSK